MFYLKDYLSGMETQLSAIIEIFDCKNTSKWTKINFKFLFTLIEYILSNFDEKHEKHEKLNRR
jgi:hypothetical protein